MLLHDRAQQYCESVFGSVQIPYDFAETGIESKSCRIKILDPNRPLEKCRQQERH